MSHEKEHIEIKISVRRHVFSWLEGHPNVFIIYKAVAIVLVWSGIWGLSDELIFPDNPLYRYIVILCIGMFMLYIDDFSLDELTEVKPMHKDAHKKKPKNIE